MVSKNCYARKVRTLLRRERGAAITEFLFSIPVILIFYIGILEVGRLIGQNDYMKVISYNAALSAAGSVQVDRSTQAQIKANTLFDNSSANQINTKQFTVVPNSDATITVRYNADLKDIAPRGLLPIPLTFESQVTVPDLTRASFNDTDTQTSEGPQNANGGTTTYCDDGMINTGNCNNSSDVPDEDQPPSAGDPSNCPTFLDPFCNGNNVPCAATSMDMPKGSINIVSGMKLVGDRNDAPQASINPCYDGGSYIPTNEAIAPIKFNPDDLPLGRH